MRKPLFWIIFVLCTLGCIAFSVTYFHQAFSIVNVTIDMTREQALEQSSALMQKFSFGPSGFRQAVAFDTDSTAQNYIELEAGGKAAYERLLETKEYRPYTWIVRNFKEGETRETTLIFTPEGTPYECTETLPETMEGAKLLADEARLIAENSAAESWSIGFSTYHLVEQSVKEQISGRLDHTFEYERNGVMFGDAPLRLSLVVSGDRLTTVDHYIKVPDLFSRKYKEMRSANNTIAMVASIAMGLLYILGGCIIGSFILLKQRYILWRQPLIWGMSVSLISTLAQANFLPLSWMNYDTALASQTFLFRQIFQLLNMFIFDGLLLVISFMAAESLTRRAFPQHVQLWKTWSRDGASSPTILGQSSGAYLLVAFFIAYEVALQTLGQKIPGWWSPSSTMTDPNILATWFPFLTPVGRSLHAGFWEECLFRAIPFAGAALIGDRFGRRKLFIVLAFIVEALIFGGGHANYAAQPSYARVIELIIPSLSFGGLYLVFGLLPAIIMHFVFDVVLMSMPLFAAHGLLFDKTMVVLLTAIPLVVVFIRRFQAGSWKSVPDALRNEAWHPAEPERKKKIDREVESGIVPTLTVKIAAVIACICCVVWFSLSRESRLFPRLDMQRTEAKEAAAAALKQTSGIDPASWTLLSSLDSGQGNEHQFVWQSGDPADYKNLLGSYLSEPHWIIRCVKFEGTQTERSEEFQVSLTSDPESTRIFHFLPEAQAGADVTEEEARQLVNDYLITHEKLNLDEFKEISAVSQKEPNRRDWSFTFQDTVHYPLTEGQARLTVTLSGDMVTAVNRFVHVPEEWERADRNRIASLSVFRSPFQIVTGLLFITFLTLSIIWWSRKRFSTAIMGRFLLLGWIVIGISFANSWPRMMAQLDTAEPLRNQILTTFAALLLPMIGYLFLGIINGFLAHFKRPQKSSSGSTAFITAVAAGSAILALKAASDTFFPLLQPYWPGVDPLNTFVPILQPVLEDIRSLLFVATFFSMIVIGIDYLTAGWQKLKVVGLVLFPVSGFIMGGALTGQYLSSYLAGSLLSGFLMLAVYLAIFRYHSSIIPLTVAVFIILQRFADMLLNAWSGAIVATVLAIVGTAAVAVLWYRLIDDLKLAPGPVQVDSVPETVSPDGAL